MATPKISTVSNPSATPTASFSGATARSASATTLGSEGRVINRLPWLYGFAIALGATALGISGYLSYVAFTSSKILGCGGGVFDCDHVLHSKWSTMLGVPVAAWASSLYLSVLAALLVTARAAVSPVPSPLRTWTWTIVTGAAVSAGLAALWFTGLQVFALKHLCPWCLSAHACGLTLCILTLTMAPISGMLKGLAAMAGTLGTLGLVTVQLMTPAPETYTVQEFPSQNNPADGAVIEPELFDAPGEGEEILMAPDAEPSASLAPTQADKALAQMNAFMRTATLAWFQPTALLTAQVGENQPAQESSTKSESTTGPAADKPEDRTIHLSGANVKLKTHQWPIVGNPNAKYVFVELFDYTCPHCRATQTAISGARNALKDDLAVIVLPVPLSRSCNDTVTNEHPSHRESCEISKIAISVWRINPERFAEYHEWLMTAQPIPTAATARAKATEIVGAEELNKELGQPHASRFIARHVDIYRRMGSGPVPKLVFSNTVLTGEMTSPKVLIDTLQRQR